MHLPDLIWEEVSLYVAPADLKKLLTLNRAFYEYVIRQKFLCLNEAQIDIFNTRFPNRLPRITSAQISSSQQWNALEKSAKLKSLVISPRDLVIKNFHPLLNYQNLQYLDVSKCPATIELAGVISQLQLKSVYLPSFWDCQDQLPSFFNHLQLLPITELFVTLEYLDFAAVSLLALPKLKKLSLEAFYVKDPESVLNIKFVNMNKLKILIHQKSTLPILIFPKNVPKLEKLSMSVNYAVVSEEDLFASDIFYKMYNIAGQIKELCLSYAHRGLSITHLSLDALLVDIKTIMYSFKLSSNLQSLSVYNINTSHLEQEINLKKFKSLSPSLVELNLSITNITVDLLRWMSRSFPNLQRLHIGGKLAADITSVKHDFPSLFQLQVGKSISGLSLIRSISAPNLAFLKMECPLPAADRKKIKKSRPSLNLLLADACPHCDIETTHSKSNIEHYITYETIKGIHTFNTYGLGAQTIYNVTKSTYSDLWK